jgi:hypothetical protein
MNRTLLRALVPSTWLLVACAGTPAGPGGDADDDDDPVGATSGDGGSASISVGNGGSGNDGVSLGGTGSGGEPASCPGDPSDVAPDVAMGAAYEAHYSWHDMGPVPGVPGRLGGCVLEAGNDDALLIAGDSEASTGAIYRIGIVRDACKHIVGFSGTATPVFTTPMVDANLLYGTDGLMIYPQWPVNQISQHPAGSTVAATTTDMATLGVESSVSGLGFVPSYLPAAGAPRTLTWSSGNWYHLDFSYNGSTYDISNAQLAVTLEGGPGGFAYVPPGSPGFPNPSIIVAEWSAHKVATYDADAQGDPIVSTRQELFTAFPSPWGAYFDPVSGDYLFLTWGSVPDRVFVVRGFSKPPPVSVPK